MPTTPWEVRFRLAVADRRGARAVKWIRPENQRVMADRRGEAIGTLEFVARSPSRVLILETLAEEGVASRESLAAEVDVVRTTLQRSLQGLADRGLIRERGTS